MDNKNPLISTGNTDIIGLKDYLPSILLISGTEPIVAERKLDR